MLYRSKGWVWNAKHTSGTHADRKRVNGCMETAVKIMSWKRVLLFLLLIQLLTLVYIMNNFGDLTSGAYQ